MSDLYTEVLVKKTADRKRQGDQRSSDLLYRSFLQPQEL